MARYSNRTLIAAVLVAVSLALGACGSSGPAASSARPTVLNTEKIERAIARSSLAQRGVTAQVSCPSGVQQTRGLSFSCTAVADGGSTDFVVSQLDGSGNVHYEAP
jgi:hypothetical protein